MAVSGTATIRLGVGESDGAAPEVLSDEETGCDPRVAVSGADG